VSEDGYQGQSHWLMFLFEVKRRLAVLPSPHAEGRFQFFARSALDGLKVPQTDRERIWPWFWRFRGGFFAAHCHCRPDGGTEWTFEEGRGPRGRGGRGSRARKVSSVECRVGRSSGAEKRGAAEGGRERFSPSAAERGRRRQRRE
jgi:hypothetical protein